MHKGHLYSVIAVISQIFVTGCGAGTDLLRLKTGGKSGGSHDPQALNLSANDGVHATGLKELNEEERAKLHKRSVTVVRPNRLSKERLWKSQGNSGERPLDDSDSTLPEIESQDIDGIDDFGGANLNSTFQLATTLPSTVDNSTLAAFPAIGNQGAQSSCVAWATAYYQMSHEYCLAVGCSNKTANVGIFSPKWTYNLINGGADGGAYFSDAYSVHAQNGAAKLSEFPYSASDFRSWDLDSSHWKGAIASRMSALSTAPINSDSAFANIKQMLANGHILVIGTYIRSFQILAVKDDPATAEVDAHTGEQVVGYLNGTTGAHAMTIIGYDDNIWTDLNGNSSVDSGEVGAFKIANSWGSSWGNGGFIWAAYDSFRSASTVAGWAPSGRLMLTQDGKAYTSVYSPRTPALIAEVQISHAARGQISLQFGSSSNTSGTPSLFWSSGSLTSDGGTFAFDGSSAEVAGTFYFDLSDIASSSPTQQNFYLLASDSVAGSPLTISGFRVVDPTSGAELFAATGLPTAIDGKSATFLAGNFSPDTQAPSQPVNLAYTLSTVKKGKTSKTSVNLTWSTASDNVGVVQYKIYRNGVLFGTSTTNKVSDTSTATGTTYSYAVSAVDSAGNESVKSSQLSVIR
jgi:C1A family cysteine protease